jgi:predicted PolB exonuclease-like 3'-5' exonuclease
MSNIITMDIETIPLSKERIKDYKEHFEPETTKRSKSRKKSTMGGLHWLTGRLVCAGVKPWGEVAQVFADENEAVIFSDLVDYLEHHRFGQLITFNGRAYDLPFLRMRGSLYGFDMSIYLPYDKFDKHHFDIYEELGGKWGINAKLSEYAWFYGLNTISGTGAEVAQMFADGDLEGIMAHNIGDLETTELIYKKVFAKKAYKDI